MIREKILWGVAWCLGLGGAVILHPVKAKINATWYDSAGFVQIVPSSPEALREIEQDLESQHSMEYLNARAVQS